MWPWRQHEDTEIVKMLKLEIELERHRYDLALQRIDRLTEALARKVGIDLIMPQPEIAPIPALQIPNHWKDPNQITVNFQGDKQ